MAAPSAPTPIAMLIGMPSRMKTMKMIRSVSAIGLSTATKMLRSIGRMISAEPTGIAAKTQPSGSPSPALVCSCALGTSTRLSLIR